MSMESTQEKIATAKATLSSAGKDLASETRLLSDPDSSSGSANGQPINTGGGGTTASQPTETTSSELPVQPMRNLPEWLLFNLVIPVLLLTAAGGVVWWLGIVQSAARPPIDDTPVGRLFALPSVNVLPVRSLASTGEKLHLSADGTVVPFREVSLATEVAGRIVEKSPLCETGKYVPKGHVLMKIDPTDYELEVKRLQRLRQQEYEFLGEIDQEMVNTKRSMELARADIELQQREVKRRESLPNQFASEGELDQARRAVLAAEQQLVVFQNQLELSKKRRTRLESSERLAAMQLEAAENNLKRTEIIAPIEGVVVSEQAELNTFVARGNVVVTMEDTSKVEVAAKLRTDQLYWVLNQKKAVSESPELIDPASGVSTQDRGYRLPPTPVIVRYVVTGREGLAYQWVGSLVGYDGIGLDEQTRTVPVRIVVDDPRAFAVIREGKVVESMEGNARTVGPTTLVRGMFVSLRLELDPTAELVVLPSEALKPGNRVWQFQPDASVLEKSIAPLVKKTDEENIAAKENDAAKANDTADETPAQPTEKIIAKTDEPSDDASDDPLASFDAAAWVPGNLLILQNVRPVDRFITTEQFTTAGPGEEDVAEIDEGSGQYWICEVPDGSLINGSFVVVSPVGSLRTDAFPVRAPASVIGTDATTDSPDIAETRLPHTEVATR